MESEINIRASYEEINKVFNDDYEINIRYMEKVKDNLYRCRIRHAEFKNYLKGTFTIKGLRKKLQKEKQSCI